MFSVKDIAEYIVLLIAAFASRYQMTDAEAYRYLSRYGAIKVAHDFYDVMNTYLFDESVLTSGELRVLTFDGYTREWADFIFLNRNNKTYKPAHDYDIVYGPWKTHQDMTEPNVTPHEFKRLKEQLTARMIHFS